MSHSRDRKLTGIAFCKLLHIESAAISQRLETILIVLASVVAENTGAVPSGLSKSGSLYWMDAHDETIVLGDGQTLPPHARRKVDARSRDVVYTLDLSGLVRDSVLEFARVRGGESFRIELAKNAALHPIKELIEK